MSADKKRVRELIRAIHSVHIHNVRRKTIEKRLNDKARNIHKENAE